MVRFVLNDFTGFALSEPPLTPEPYPFTDPQPQPTPDPVLEPTPEPEPYQ